MTPFSRFTLAGCLLLGVCLVLRAEDKPKEDMPPKGVSMFTCAHSFHIFVPGKLNTLAKLEKIADHQLLGQQMIGGSKVKQHWDLADAKNKAKSEIAKGNVEVLTLSPHVYLPDEGIDRFVELALKHNPKARILVQFSWHPWDTLEKDAKITDNKNRDKIDMKVLQKASDKFRTNLEDQVKAINAKLDKPAVYIVPVGEAVLKLRDLVSQGKVPGVKMQSELFTDAIGHAKPSVQALATYCYYVAIYKKKPTAFLPEVKKGDKEQQGLYKLLQEIAWETVSKYPQSGVK